MNDEEDKICPVEQIWNSHIVVVHASIDCNAGRPLKNAAIESRATPIAGRESEQLAGGSGEAKERILAVRVYEKTIAEEGLEEALEIPLSIPGWGERGELEAILFVYGARQCITLLTERVRRGSNLLAKEG